MVAVRLRPLTPADLESVWAARSADAQLPGTAGPDAKERLRERLSKDLTLEGDGFLELGIEVEARLVGDVQARHPKNAMPHGVVEIGISLLPEARGQGYGREALRAFVDQLFEEHGAERVQGSTALGNAAMRRVFELLGWTYEGVMRSFARSRDGGREDYALYAITRSEWESRNSRSSSDT